MLAVLFLLPVLCLYSLVSVGDTITNDLPSLLVKEEEVTSFQFFDSVVQVVVAALHDAVVAGSDKVPYPIKPRLGMSRSVNVLFTQFHTNALSH